MSNKSAVQNGVDLSGPERGEVNLRKLRDYLETLKTDCRTLPMDGDKPNISAIAKESGVNRNAFYTNSGIKKLLREFAGVNLEVPNEDAADSRYLSQIERLEGDKLQLQQKLAAAQAENEELRERLTETEQKLTRYTVIEEEVFMVGRGITL